MFRRVRCTSCFKQFPADYRIASTAKEFEESMQYLNNLIEGTLYCYNGSPFSFMGLYPHGWPFRASKINWGAAEAAMSYHDGILTDNVLDGCETMATDTDVWALHCISRTATKFELCGDLEKCDLRREKKPTAVAFALALDLLTNAIKQENGSNIARWIGYCGNCIQKRVFWSGSS